LLPATPIIILGEPFIELSLVDSTNIYAMEQVKQGLASSGSCYFAHFQTRGKGQFTKFWESETSQNILSSYVLALEGANPTQQFGFSVAISLGLYDFFNSIAGEETSIKWPNDLYWRDRKAGGILIENLLRGSEWTWSIIGIGINVNQTQFSKEVPNPVSLKQITGKSFDPIELTSSLSKCLSIRLNEWQLGNLDAMLLAYNSHLYKLGSTVKFKNKNIHFSGIVKGVNKQGQLIIDQGIEQTYNFGEIIWDI